MQNNLDLAVIAVGGLVSFLVGLDKGGLAGALGVLAVPLLSLVLPVEQAAGLLLPVLLVGDAFALSAHWRRWDWGLFRALIPGGVVGTLIGTLVLVSAPAQWLRWGLGAFVVLFVVYKLFIEKRVAAGGGVVRRAWHGWLAGGLSGISSAVAHAGGPPVTVYLLQQEIEPRAFVATSALYFAVLNAVKVPWYMAERVFDGIDLPVMLMMIPFMPLGVYAGRYLALRVDRPTYERIVLGLLCVSAVLLFVTRV